MQTKARNENNLFYNPHLIYENANTGHRFQIQISKQQMVKTQDVTIILLNSKCVRFFASS